MIPDRLSSKLLAICVTFCSLFCTSTPSLAAPELTLETRPLVVLVFDQSCIISCNRVRPIMKELEADYAGRVQFIYLDVSKERVAEAEKIAKTLEISRFLSDTEDWYPAVGVFSSRHKLTKLLLGARSRDDYKAAIEKAMLVKK